MVLSRSEMLKKVKEVEILGLPVLCVVAVAYISHS